MEAFLQRLRDFDALRDDPTCERVDNIDTRMQASCPPAFADQSHYDGLPPALKTALAAQGITNLYAHQAEAIERIMAGQDVVLEAPTASGKTLCFDIPLILNLMKYHCRNFHALMFHPMKALSNDQRRQFQSLAQVVKEECGQALESWVFDGDTEKEHRRAIKNSPPSLLLTNPEMLHYSFLGWQDQWQKFLKSLRLIIIDEIHEYRGFFGTNVALLLRRFLNNLTKYTKHRPQIVLATATCGNAEEHAYRLTGRRCTLVRAQETMRAGRHFSFIEPDIPDYHYHDIYRLRIARAALACADQGLTSLVFCPSRKFAEETALQAKKDAEGFGIDPDTIAPYRSGYEAELRRQIEDGLRDGRYKAVFSTNALEIGVDIGLLDVCILAGFPNSVFSAWQRIGRAGRGWKRKAHVLYYALNNPFDRFYARNIDAFLNKPLDEILIGVDNEELMGKHLPYLVHETGGEFHEDHSKILGKPFLEYARNRTAGTTPVRGSGPSYQHLNIRGGANKVFRLKYKDREIGTISDAQLFREAYIGAVYNHFGKSYRVVGHGGSDVQLEAIESNLRTEGSFYTVVQVDEMRAGFRYAATLAAYYGKLTVFDNFAGYRLIDTRTGDVIEEEKTSIARSSKVRGFWIELEDTSAIQNPHCAQTLFGFEQFLRIGTPFVASCDRHDIGTQTNGKHLPSVYLFETVPGGIGIAEKALDLWQSIVKTGIHIAEDCDCPEGCPSCMVPPRVPSGFKPPEKGPSVSLAHELLDIVESSQRARFDPDVYSWVPDE